jgi:hypothetical protein
MAKRSQETGRKSGGTITTDVSSATTAAAIEERLVAFAEQLGRIAGAVKIKAKGWLDRDTVSQQLTHVRDAAADLLDQLARSVRESPKTTPAAARPSGATPRSGGVVDAPGKKHRKPMPADPDARRAASQAAKIRPKMMVKTNRRRGRG